MRRRARVIVCALVAIVVGVPILYFNAPPPGKGGMTGRYWLHDDTGLPDIPANKGQFLVVPGVTVYDLWPEEVDPDVDRWFNTFMADFEFEELEEKYAATLVDVQRNGRFRVQAPPGPTVICRIGLLGGVFGCSELDLPESGSLKASSSEGGFRIDVQ